MERGLNLDFDVYHCVLRIHIFALFMCLPPAPPRKLLLAGVSSLSTRTHAVGVYAGVGGHMHV